MAPQGEAPVHSLQREWGGLDRPERLEDVWGYAGGAVGSRPFDIDICSGSLLGASGSSPATTTPEETSRSDTFWSPLWTPALLCFFKLCLVGMMTYPRCQFTRCRGELARCA